MRFRFGEFLLDDESFRLSRRGSAVALRRKVFDLLVVLVRERERVVLREELVARLWSSTTVGAGSLSGLVNELRAALGEGGHGPSTIRTVHARGYQFAARIDVEGEAAGEVEAEGEGGSPMVERSSGEGFLRTRLEVMRSGARALCAALPEPVRRARWLALAMAQAAEAGFQARWQVVAEDPVGDRGRRSLAAVASAAQAIPPATDPGNPDAARAPIALGLEVREPAAWLRTGGLPRLLDRLGRAPVIVIAAIAGPHDDAGVRGLIGSDPRIEWVGTPEPVEAPRAPRESGQEGPPTPTALVGILRALARVDAAEFEAALRAMGFESGRLGPIRAPRRVEPLPHPAEGRRGSEGI